MELLHLTARELDAFGKLQYETGLTGKALQDKFLEQRNRPTKSWMEEENIAPDDYPGEYADLYCAVIDLYLQSRISYKTMHDLMGKGTPQNKALMKELLAKFQITPTRERFNSYFEGR